MFREVNMEDRYMIRFTTLYPRCSNVELVKDVGQIPYTLAKNYKDIESTLAGCNIDKNGSNIKNIDGLKIDVIHAPFHSLNLAGILYLIRNAKKIDILNVYHAGRSSYYFMRLYKFINHSGKTFLKLDLDFRSCDMYDNDEWECKLFKKNTDISDYITVESEAIKDRIQKYSSKDIKILNNGYCKSSVEPDITRKRNNTFITVGRLGTKQKATEVLMEAFARCSNLHDWNLVLIGSIEEEFKSWIEKFYKEHPNLRERVVFKGEIKERETLYNEYCSARVFILSSRWEGFALVGCEALSCGCRMIVSDKVPPYKEITNAGTFGKTVPADDVDALSEAMLSETKYNLDYNEVKTIKDYADERFSWEKICDVLMKFFVE